MEPWGPEDEGTCPCGGCACDGTCDTNSTRWSEWRAYDLVEGDENVELAPDEPDLDPDDLPF